MFRRYFVLAAYFLTGALCTQPPTALAQGLQIAIEQCNSSDATPAVRVEACTLLLKDNTTSELTRSVFYALRGLAYLDMRQPANAIADFDRAIAIRSDVGLAYRARGLAHAQAKEYARAIADFSQAVRLDPQDGKSFNARGWAHFESGQFDRAIADLDHSIALNPNSADFRVAACFMRAMTGRQLDRAEPECHAAVRLDPKDSRVFAARGLLNLKYGRFKAALADYEEAVKLERTAEHLYGKGMARQRLDDRAGSDDKAWARSLDPGIDSLFVYYGFIPFEIPEKVWQQHDEACRKPAGSGDQAMHITSCSMLIDAGFLDHKDQAMALAWRSHLFSTAGLLSQAKTDLDRSLALVPEKSETWWGRAIMRIGLKDYAGAKSDYDEALRRTPKSAYALYGRGFVRLRLGDHGGREDIQAARQLDPAVERYYASIGMQAD